MNRLPAKRSSSMPTARSTRSRKSSSEPGRNGWPGWPIREGTTDDAKKGPLALEFREPNSTTLVKGVITLVPVASIESLVFDHAKQEVTL